jgi:hypothetical protein
MLQRTLPTGFIVPCLPTKANTPPSGGLWLHEIKHDGFRVIARKHGTHRQCQTVCDSPNRRRMPMHPDPVSRLETRTNGPPRP